MTLEPIQRGRFAPSPTGPLHLGSLVAALGSYLNLRQTPGQWRVRIDDIDQPRNIPQIDQTILHTLECHGLEWDGEIYYSSQHIREYEQAFDRLSANGFTYRCSCSRREIDMAPINHGRRKGDTLIYPGTCRSGAATGKQWRSYRVRVSARPVEFLDQLQGQQCEPLLDSVGDFVIRNARGQFNYQLATVVDDHLQGITQAVRGSDLLASTARQIHLQERLGYNRPDYLHLPVITDTRGNKLSKQQGAQPLDNTQAVNNLITALALLQQQPPEELAFATPSEIIQWGVAHWNRSVLKQVRTCTTPPK